MTKQKFYAMLATVETDALRDRIEDNAIGNARDTWIENGKRYAFEGPEFWDVAITTAEMMLDAPKDYFPELFA